MRTAFIDALYDLAEREDRLWLLTGDLGFSVLERFADRFPGRYINVGVAEQNMAGIAAGLALSGKIVFTYSIANFPTLRCLEQIRNDICYHAANVKIVSVGGGLAYGALSMTHHGTEDLSIMRALPGMRVIAPGDPIETRLATEAIIAETGPCYLRLGKAGEPVVHTSPPPFQIGKAIMVREGRDVTLISTGAMLKNSVEAAALLAEKGIECRLLSMHTLKPIDREAVLSAAGSSRLLVTVEENSVLGGLGGAVAELMAEAGTNARLCRIGIPDRFADVVGSQEYLRGQFGLSATQIAGKISQLV